MKIEKVKVKGSELEKLIRTISANSGTDIWKVFINGKEKGFLTKYNGDYGIATRTFLGHTNNTTVGFKTRKSALDALVNMK